MHAEPPGAAPDGAEAEAEAEAEAKAGTVAEVGGVAKAVAVVGPPSLADLVVSHAEVGGEDLTLTLTLTLALTTDPNPNPN